MKSTEIRAFKAIRYDVSEKKPKMEKSAPEVHRINTVATHILKDDMKMKFGVYIDYELTIIYAKFYDIISSVNGCNEFQNSLYYVRMNLKD